jgi:hypothetical protein
MKSHEKKPQDAQADGEGKHGGSIPWRLAGAKLHADSDLIAVHSPVAATAGIVEIEEKCFPI